MAAEKIKGLELCFRDATDPNEEEFYYSDLIGLDVEDEGGKMIGQVKMMDNYGAGEVMEVTLAGRHCCCHLPGRWSRLLMLLLVKSRLSGLLKLILVRKKSLMTRVPCMNSWAAKVLTLFPDMFPGPLGYSLAGKALMDELWSLGAIDIRCFAGDKHQTVDDTPFGGGPGMVMRPDVMDRALDEVMSDLGDLRLPVLYMSPRGAPLT